MSSYFSTSQLPKFTGGKSISSGLYSAPSVSVLTQWILFCKCIELNWYNLGDINGTSNNWNAVYWFSLFFLYIPEEVI